MAVTVKPQILLVEDEPAQREVIAYNLAAEGYAVTEAGDGEEAMLMIAENPPDLVILDWMMPNLSGIEVCRRLKADPETRAIPVIMLSARMDIPDRVRGLETGADDYISKPYSMAELMARIRANLRRANPASVAAVLEFQDLRLDGETRRVTRAGQDIDLSPTEFRLLAILMERPGRVLSRERLLDRVWGRDIHVETRTVDVHIGRLRKALSRHGGSDLLRTVRGTGYALG